METTTSRSTKRIVGYCDPLSVEAGSTVRFMVSSLDEDDFQAQLVRLVCGDVSPGGHGFAEEQVASAADGTYAGRYQPLRSGSCAIVAPHPLLAVLRSVRVDVAVWPTAPTGRRQVLVSTGDGHGGFALVLDPDGCIAAEVGGAGARHRLRVDVPTRARHWHRVHLGFDGADGTLTLSVQPEARSIAERAAAPPSVARTTVDAVVASSGPLVFAAELDGDGHPGSHLDGRLDECRLGDHPGSAPTVVWDLARDIGSDRITDVGVHGLHGRTHQLPTRAVPGVRWTGEVHDWRVDPSHYGAIHFHADDLVDARWQPSVDLAVPTDTPSGVYALRVRTATSEDHMPFFVLPAAGAATADIAFLAPTVTYRAYANVRLTASPDHVFGNGSPADMDNDRFLLDHPEVGLGHYDHHADGSGVVFSSHLRPVMNLKPKGGVWSFTADTNVLAWLRHTALAHDVVTDDALHARGAEVLEPYRVIVTGTHPEYWTTPMLDALESYLDGGGRLLYLGANGFYWRASFHPAAPGTVEVRRAEDGTRAWIAEPGEYHHESTGELGGLWRRIGRPPNLVAGVGFSAQGFGASGWYRRSSGWDDPRVAFATEGLSDEPVLGRHGVVGGGAAGHEVDRFDPSLGSPAHAVVLASSEGLPPDMLLTKEELFANGFAGAAVRSDVVFFEGPRGGAVFSASSIAWAASLATDGYDNDLARLTGNVLRRFADPTPFPPPPAG